MTSTLAPGAQAKAITNPATTSRFHEDIIAGLSANQKTIPSQWLYDEKGSKLFEEITRLPEYYPTRTETEILRSHADQLTSRINAEAVLIEYGAGASEKTRILLDQLPDLSAYVPIDVSEDFLAETAQDLRESYPGLKVEPVVADFLGDIKMPPLPENQRVGFFPGSTIGNLSDPEIHAFLIRAHRLIGGSGAFILGVDLRKPIDILIPAYDDAAGITAAFNLNLLHRANRELGADFEPSKFRHRSLWNESESRIEMHLVSTADQTVRISDQVFTFEAGETIHTENSRKFSLEDMHRLCGGTGWRIADIYKDRHALFAVLILQPCP